MGPDAIAAIIAGSGVFISLISAIFVAGRKQGISEYRLQNLENKVNEAATKEGLTALQKDVAEIKGMFRLTFKDGSN